MTNKITRVRKAHWDLHRRLVNENSAIFLKYDDIVNRQRKQKPIQILSAFLKKANSEARRERLGFSIEPGVFVPEYIANGFLFLEDKYDGGYLNRDKINLQVAVGGGKPPSLHYGFDRKTPNRAPTKISDAQVSALEDG